jgi:hypothetical protein
VFIVNATRGEVRSKIEQILELARGDWHRFRLVMPDVEYGTPDDNLEEVYWACKEKK